MGTRNAQSGRLDQYVTGRLPKLSRTSAAQIVEAGKVEVNGKAVVKPGYRLKPGDTVKINYEPGQTPPPRINLPVIYEDDDCVVIDKPAGILSHSKGIFNPEATVATWLSGRIKGMSGERAGIVHRLDRPTSGVMICAKTPDALYHLQKQFSQRKAKKTYLAVVDGAVKPPKALIDMPIERNPKRPQTFRTGSNGKPALTEYRVLKTDGLISLLELKPATGRTHQLRVHLKHIGHPIVGDTLYGKQAARRLFLHAQSLEITLPNGHRQTFKVPLPAEFKEVFKG